MQRPLRPRPAPFDQRGRSRWRQPGQQQPVAQARQRHQAHVHRQRPTPGRRLKIDRQPPVLRVPGHERERPGRITVRQRNTRLGRAGQCGGHPGYNLPRDTRRAQRLQLLAAPAKHERVAALQPHNLPTGLAKTHQQGVDFMLRQAMVGATFTDIDPFGRGRDQIQNLVRHQPVIDDHVGRRDQTRRAQRQQVRRTRPGAD